MQGAAHAGATRIIAVDPVAFKREAALRFGATDAVESMAERPTWPSLPTARAPTPPSSPSESFTASTSRPGSRPSARPAPWW